MKILLTSGGGARGAALADHLAQTHEIRMTERAYVETEHEFVQCGLGHDRSTNLLTRGHRRHHSWRGRAAGGG